MESEKEINGSNLLRNRKEEKKRIAIFVTSDLHFGSIFCVSVGKCIKGDKRYSYVGGYIWREVKNGEIIQNALDIDVLIQNYDKANPLINGVRHSITEWCKIFNISRQSVYRRVYSENMDIITALTLKKRR